MLPANFKFNSPAFVLACLVFLMLSCTRYYKPIPTDVSYPKATVDVIADNLYKYLILRQGVKSYHLSRVALDNEAMVLKADLVPVGSSHRQYLNAKPNRYGYTDPDVINEVHIFSKDSTSLDIAQPFSLPLDRIAKIEIIQHDKKRTSTSYTVGTIITVGVIAGIIAVVATLAVQDMSFGGYSSGGYSSCPFIGVYDGSQYVVQGEIYGGAIKKSLERRDFLPLAIQPVNGAYQIRISNELREKQYTNYADLMVIEHSANNRVGITPDGKAYPLSAPVRPTKATLNDGRNVLKLVAQKDELTCSFDDTLRNETKSELMLTFDPQTNRKNARLILNLRNSLWLDNLYNEFSASFAGRYDKWQQRLDKTEAEELNQWLVDQQIPLHIAVSTAGGWQEVMKVKNIGPLMLREMVIPIELDKGSKEPIRIKLSTGFLFWEVDYAALDFTSDEPLISTVIKPYSALDEKGKDVLMALINDDGQYLEQPEIGSYTIVKYKLGKEATPGMVYSVALSAKGYYEPIRDYTGDANWSFIREFKKPGTMNTFSREKYYTLFRSQPGSPALLE